MSKTFLILTIIIVLAVVCVGGYFGTGYYLKNYAGSEFLFVHPTMAKIFNAAPVCPMACIAGGVCGKDGKNYCNECLAFQHGAGYAHDGACLPVGWKNYDNFGVEFQYPQAWPL